MDSKPQSEMHSNPLFIKKETFSMRFYLPIFNHSSSLKSSLYIFYILICIIYFKVGMTLKSTLSIFHMNIIDLIVNSS